VDLSTNLNALIIPVAILIVIGSIISAVVLKVLLDSLDKELYEL
jgi:signal transduction histidine kinase